ncbi:hypothetical protein AAF712_002569 [Marasmius tenuissimus]|uniref:Uncharacterized protein n=1 Tax=Marasmius tenuissimus TaxID=585030 RepID=A0ABR3A9J6_9AGAR
MPGQRSTPIRQITSRFLYQPHCNDVLPIPSFGTLRPDERSRPDDNTQNATPPAPFLFPEIHHRAVHSPPPIASQDGGGSEVREFQSPPILPGVELNLEAAHPRNYNIASGQLTLKTGGRNAREPSKSPSKPKRISGKGYGVKDDMQKRRSRIRVQQPYGNLRSRKITGRNTATLWYALASPGPFSVPPPPSSEVENMTLFLHLDTNVQPNYMAYGENDYDSFIAMWIWEGVWRRVMPGHVRIIDNIEYCLEINQCYEPAWVLPR